MTPRQIIASHIRQYRTIPAGSIIWLHAPGFDDFVSVDEVGRSLDAWLEKMGTPSELTIHLDTPEGDFEDQWCLETSIFKLPPPVREVVEPAKVIARRKRVTAFGEKTIFNAERIIQLYTDYLTNMYRREFGYIGKSPDVRVNWATKHSWGGHRNITISPGYLYEPDLVEIYGLRMFAWIKRSGRSTPVTGLTTLRRWWRMNWLIFCNSIRTLETLTRRQRYNTCLAWITKRHMERGGNICIAI